MNYNEEGQVCGSEGLGILGGGGGGRDPKILNLGRLQGDKARAVPTPHSSWLPGVKSQ